MKIKIEGIDETLEKIAHVSELLREARDVEDIDEALEKIACANTLLREIKPIGCLCEIEFKAESENDLSALQSTEGR